MYSSFEKQRIISHEIRGFRGIGWLPREKFENIVHFDASFDQIVS